MNFDGRMEAERCEAWGRLQQAMAEERRCKEAHERSLIALAKAEADMRIAYRTEG
jgi:hypothetical protein